MFSSASGVSFDFKVFYGVGIYYSEIADSITVCYAALPFLEVSEGNVFLVCITKQSAGIFIVSFGEICEILVYDTSRRFCRYAA